jgi:hypothetical protein
MNEQAIIAVTNAGVFGDWGWLVAITMLATSVVAYILSKLGAIVKGLNEFRVQWSKFHKPKHHDYAPQLKLDADITNHLRVIKHETQASRVLIIQLHNGDYSIARVPFLKYTCSHEQLGKGVSSVMLHIDRVQASMYAEINDKLMRGENVCFPKFEDVGDSSPSLSSLKQFLSAHGVKSVYFFPLTDASGSTYGMGSLEYTEEYDLPTDMVRWSHNRFIQIGGILSNLAYEEDDL